MWNRATTNPLTAEHLGVAGGMTLEDLRREAWHLWDCEPSGPQLRREQLRIELVDLQLELDRISLRPGSSPSGADAELAAPTDELLRLRSSWRRDDTQEMAA